MPVVKGENPDASSFTCSPKYNAPGRVLAILLVRHSETSGMPSLSVSNHLWDHYDAHSPSCLDVSLSLSFPLPLLFLSRRSCRTGQTVNYVPFHLLILYLVLLVLTLSSRLYSLFPLLCTTSSPWSVISQYFEWKLITHDYAAKHVLARRHKTTCRVFMTFSDPNMLFPNIITMNKYVKLHK